MKFRSYSYSKKSVDMFLNKIKETFGDNLIIGYGNWSRDTQMKNFMPTMGKGFRKLIHRKYDTITVNECMTSKNCCDCMSTLENYKDTKGKRYTDCWCVKGMNPYVLKTKKAVFKTRDLNSAINILHLTKKWIQKKERPEEFNSKYCSSPSESEDKVEPYTRW